MAPFVDLWPGHFLALAPASRSSKSENCTNSCETFGCAIWVAFESSFVILVTILSDRVCCSPTHSYGMAFALEMYALAASASQSILSYVTTLGAFIISAQSYYNLWLCKGLVSGSVSIHSNRKFSMPMHPLDILSVIKKNQTFMCLFCLIKNYLPLFIAACLSCCPGTVCYWPCTPGPIWNRPNTTSVALRCVLSQAWYLLISLYPVLVRGIYSS